MLNLNEGTIRTPEKIMFEEYADDWELNEGDIVEMITEGGFISFGVNNIDLGIAFEDERIEDNKLLPFVWFEEKDLWVEVLHGKLEHPTPPEDLGSSEEDEETESEDEEKAKDY